MTTEQHIPAVASSDGLGDGNDLYRRAINECHPEHKDLMVSEWSPTPWMLDVTTEGREDEIWHWCYRHFGQEAHDWSARIATDQKPERSAEHGLSDGSA